MLECLNEAIRSKSNLSNAVSQESQLCICMIKYIVLPSPEDSYKESSRISIYGLEILHLGGARICKNRKTKFVHKYYKH